LNRNEALLSSVVESSFLGADFTSLLLASAAGFGLGLGQVATPVEAIASDGAAEISYGRGFLAPCHAVAGQAPAGKRGTPAR
jgi:hypothetical protein